MNFCFSLSVAASNFWSKSDIWPTFSPSWSWWPICKFWIQNHFCAILGESDIFKTKLGSEIDKFIFILTWSGPHSTRMALRCPNWPLTGLVIPWGAQSCPNWSLKGCLGQSGACHGSSRTILHCYGQFRSFLIWPCSFQNSFLFCKYLSPLILHRNGSVFWIYIL